MLRYLFVLIVFATLSFAYEIHYDKNTTGFIRHLKLYKHPEWAAKIELADGKELYFCSPKSMFDLYFNPYKWPHLHIKKEEDFKALIVTDFTTLKPIDAKKAFFVYGSRAISPAGDDLPAFSSRKEAEAFVKKYGGSRILPFERINRALINLLDGRI